MKKILLTVLLVLLLGTTALGQKAEYKIEEGTLTFFGGKVRKNSIR